ncbi:hypothetical protein [Alteribacter aurantiacus]|uniref:hypothetical protein n=1 Tax=Alteribacter aurantiacus TaxID=254410 RepID=UPI0004119862|nr:hypothetical protein [Alteribacter aurantiacus]
MNEHMRPKQEKLPSWRTPAIIAMVFLWVTTAFFLWLPNQLEKETMDPDWAVQVYTRENPIREGGDVTLQVFVFDNQTKDPIKGADIEVEFDTRETPLILHYVENGLYENVSQVEEHEVLSGNIIVKRENFEANRPFTFPVESFTDEWANTSAFYMKKTKAVSH